MSRISFKLLNSLQRRYLGKYSKKIEDGKSTAYYMSAVGITMLGVTFASVPIYKQFCQQVGMGGNSEYARVKSIDVVKNLVPMKDRSIKVEFGGDVMSPNQWTFEPVQKEIHVVPGETALAFYKAKNLTDKPVIGIATYNIIPYEAAKYFHKIQCFCFEEQLLNPGEEVDMPVFFFIDPEFDSDHKLVWCDNIYLSYTFMDAKSALEIPLPGFLKS